MSVIITGLVIHNKGKTSVALTAADGPQTFSEELEARLVSQGVAKYVGEKPARREPTYSVDMKAAELREIMEDCGLQYKVGMSKADMVAALDAYFGDEVENEDTPPDLGAEDPVL